jgi:hypothetical protein
MSYITYKSSQWAVACSLLVSVRRCDTPASQVSLVSRCVTPSASQVNSVSRCVTPASWVNLVSRCVTPASQVRWAGTHLLAKITWWARTRLLAELTWWVGVFLLTKLTQHVLGVCLLTKSTWWAGTAPAHQANVVRRPAWFTKTSSVSKHVFCSPS